MLKRNLNHQRKHPHPEKANNGSSGGGKQSCGLIVGQFPQNGERSNVDGKKNEPRIERIGRIRPKNVRQQDHKSVFGYLWIG
jgi:hypothetical protein